ncbi:IclR family transcriptional regulator [Halanaerobium salsuginis]|uniref:Transcriptional regulator, IclR family n=1 Tax=Halanaerobium salsuginis TaxID=29563 RepID=A0A1I4IIT9_9FIRM|nr:IclR family transcriptional regulator [Halanaerobium salsuginis]SFL54007.1 transcriptional regulator, IclR family [Halanaerobium salsuginis]
MEKEYLNQSLANAFKILELFNENNLEYTAQEITELLEFSSSSVWRLLQSLEYLGYLKKNNHDKYSLGFKGLNFAKIILNSLEVRRVALPYVNKLAADLEVNVSLGILDQQEVTYILRAPSPNIPDTYYHVGRRVPLHATGLGKILLAFQIKAKQTEIISNLKLEKITENTITSQIEFKRELEQVNKNGYANDDEEYIKGTRCIAVPIWNSQGMIEAALSISDRRLFKEQKIVVEENLEKLSTTANKISHILGYSLYNPL